MPSRLHLLLPALTCLAPAASALELPYRVGAWPEPGRGNHRAVVHVEQAAEAVRVHIPWRRRDQQPETKDIRVYDSATGQRVTDLVRISVTRESGDLAFAPPTAPGDYEVYYLPYNPGVSNFDDPGTYFPPTDTADPEWAAGNGLTAEALAAGGWRDLPEAQVVAIEARTEFDRMDPMEVIATRAETEALLAAHPGASYLVFPEDRRFPIRMFEDVPARWAETGPAESFTGEARPNEYYTLQLGIYAARADLTSLELRFSDLRSPDGARTIPAAALTSINLEGTDWLGRAMRPTFSVGLGRVRALWIGIDVPRDASGLYEGEITVVPAGLASTTIPLRLEVAGPVLEDRGDSELWRFSRIRWLNSTLGLDDEVIPPYTPVTLEGDTVGCLGRAVGFGPTGAPASIVSWGRELLASPVRFVVETADGPVTLETTERQLVRQTRSAVEFAWTAAGAGVTVRTRARMEYDGYVRCETRVEAERATEVRDIRLEIPLRREAATYVMGFSRRGGYRPPSLQWKWDANRCDNDLWIGDVAGGIQLRLLPERDGWSLNGLHELGLPAGWCNDGRGGAEVSEAGEEVLVRAYSGPRTLTPGVPVDFRYRLLVTPFRQLDPERWNWRMGDLGAGIATAGNGANIAHIHHARPENPYINYPFLTLDQLRADVEAFCAQPVPRIDFGQLTYPAEGNLQLARGALHLWTRLRFDPTVGSAGNAAYNQALFSLAFPNQDEVGFYWNIDVRGMRAYLRRGAPSRNEYPAMLDAGNLPWREGERHLLTLSWGEELAIFVDGQRLAAMGYQGLVPTDLAGALLRLEGTGFELEALKVTSEPYREGEEVAQAPDAGTLLLDQLGTASAPGEPRPVLAGVPGETRGECEFTREDGRGVLRFSSRPAPDHGRGVNVYYTVRELSNHVYEMWPLRSLGDEIFATGGALIYSATGASVSTPGGGYPWLQEHLVEGYSPAWRQPLPDWGMDAAIATQGLSRWHNYYVEGLRYLWYATGIDGLYLDGIGYDRRIMQRVRKTVNSESARTRLNFHCGNDYDYLDRRTSPANEYMEHFPYLSNLWFGEMYDYDSGPDYWLVEMSGLPFGLGSEMLNYENGGNPYRGMVYGMGGRQLACAAYLWSFWDEFGIQEAEMLGYWSPQCPVTTDNAGVLATVYRKPGRSLIALAHWPALDEARRVAVAPLGPPPTVDGNLEDTEWAGAARLGGFTKLGSHDSPSMGTEAYARADETSLTIAFRFAKAPGALKALAQSEGKPVCEDDAVEVFIQPNPDEPTYYQFVGNSTGYYADNVGPGGAWDGDWTYRVMVAEDSWYGEISIPWADLGRACPAEGEEIGLNVCRDLETPSHEWITWAPLRSTFHQASAFGRLRFSAVEPPTREPAARESGQAGPLAVRLTVDWAALGLDPAKVRLTAPAIERFQPAREFGPGDAIPIEAAKGVLLVAGDR